MTGADMTITNEAMTRSKEEVQAERHAFVEAQQGSWEKLSGALTSGMGDKGYIPVLPPIDHSVPSISPRMRAELSSQPYCEQRSEKAKRLPALRAAAEKATKRAQAVDAELEKAAKRLAELDADTDQLASNIDARVAVRMKVDMLRQDATRLGMSRGLTNGQVVEAEQALADPLARWAQARVDYCKGAIPILQAALAEAEKVCQWKSEEARTGKPWKGGLPQRESDKRYPGTARQTAAMEPQPDE